MGHKINTTTHSPSACVPSVYIVQGEYANTSPQVCTQREYANTTRRYVMKVSSLEAQSARWFFSQSRLKLRPMLSSSTATDRSLLLYELTYICEQLSRTFSLLQLLTPSKCTYKLSVYKSSSSTSGMMAHIQRCKCIGVCHITGALPISALERWHYSPHLLQML